MNSIRANRSAGIKPAIVLPGMLVLPLLVALPQGTLDLVDVWQYGSVGCAAPATFHGFRYP